MMYERLSDIKQSASFWGTETRFPHTNLASCTVCCFWGPFKRRTEELAKSLFLKLAKKDLCTSNPIFFHSLFVRYFQFVI